MSDKHKVYTKKAQAKNLRFFLLFSTEQFTRSLLPRFLRMSQ